tara:strand:- start:7227 stop:9458 length:2232 start_codon:yes stop_codon:yes gene_type:complete
MRKLFIIFLLVIFHYTFLNAEIIKQVQINGNKRVSDETVMIYGEIKKNKNYTEKDINTVLKNLYQTNFFENVNIELSNGILKVNLVEYPIINNLIVLGEPSNKYKESIIKIIESKEKDSFIENRLNNDIEKIKRLYAENGFNFVTIDTKIKKTDDRNINLIFEIDRGEVTKIKKISFVGDKKIREKRLRDVIASEESKFWKVISRNTRFNKSLIDLDIRLLKNYYKSLGYYDIKVSSSSAEMDKTGNIEITYSIDAGKRYIIKKIITNADSIFDKDIFFDLNNSYKKVVGTYYSPFKIKKLLEDLDELIEKNNLQFVEHNVEEIIENESIIVKFNVTEGEKILVERINILGNNVTNESVIRSELLLDEGDPFTKLALDKSISKIKARKIFRTVSSKVLDGSTPNSKILDIIVEEQPTGEISAGAGVGTNGGSFAFIVKENNWLGEGKQVSFDIDVNKESLKGSLNYSDPNYDFLGNQINYNLYSTTNDKPEQGYENTIVGAGVSTSFEQYKDLYTSLGVDVSYDDLRTQDSASETLKKQKGQFTELAGTYGFSYDRRNRAFMPTSGSIIKFRQSIPVIADKAFIANTFSSSIYKSFTEDVIGATKIYLSSIDGIGADNVRLSKRLSLPSRRVRGFERGKIGPRDGSDHVGGNHAAALNFELNLPTLLPESTKTDVGLFLDFANVWGVDYDTTLGESNKLRSSTGVSASWLSPLGPMSFILSTNLTKADTDVTESFNFNLGTTF